MEGHLSTTSPESLPKFKFTFFVDGLGIDVSAVASTEREAHKLAWQSLTEEQKESTACLDCVNVEKITMPFTDIDDAKSMIDKAKTFIESERFKDAKFKVGDPIYSITDRGNVTCTCVGIVTELYVYGSSVHYHYRRDVSGFISNTSSQDAVWFDTKAIAERVLLSRFEALRNDGH
jgi:hypothetical protein